MHVEHQIKSRYSSRRSGILATKELCMVVLVLAALVWVVVPQLLHWATLQNASDAKARSRLESAFTRRGVRRTSLDRTGRRLWVSRLDHSVVQLDVTTGAAEQSLPLVDFELLSAKHSQDGQTSLALSLEGEVALFRYGNQLQFIHWVGKDFRRGDTEVSADGNVALIVLDNGLVQGWMHQESQVEPFSYSLQNESTVDCTALDLSGRLLFVAHRDGTATVYEARTGRVEKEFPKFARVCSAAAWSGEGHTIAAGFMDGSVRVLDARSGETTAELLHVKKSNLVTPRVVGLAISATGDKLVATVTGSNDIFVWD